MLNYYTAINPNRQVYNPAQARMAQMPAMDFGAGAGQFSDVARGQSQAAAVGLDRDDAALRAKYKSTATAAQNASVLGGLNLLAQGAAYGGSSGSYAGSPTGQRRPKRYRNKRLQQYRLPEQSVYSQRQSNGAYNNNVAAAMASANPLAHLASKPGVSRGAGQQAYAAAEAAGNYVKGMKAAASGRMEDAYANASEDLQKLATSDQFLQQLAQFLQRNQGVLNTQSDRQQGPSGVLTGLFR